MYKTFAIMALVANRVTSALDEMTAPTTTTVEQALAPATLDELVEPR